jgi:RNA polymerase sigma-70 factor (ECF subfamily)
MAQRISRAKRTVSGLRLNQPGDLATVLRVLYLVFNEGYSATASEELVRRELCDEAIRLAKLLAVLMPDEPEARGLLALMLLQDSRRDARVSAEGELVLLEDQDRRLWDAGKIEEGLRVLDRAVALRRPGPYQLQAAIAALHAQAQTPEETDWEQIATLYGALEELTGSAVVSLNKAVAVAMARGPDAGLHEVDGLSGLEAYHLFHATRADLLRRLERAEEAAAAYRRALELVTSPVERRYLERRLRSLA